MRGTMVALPAGLLAAAGAVTLLALTTGPGFPVDEAAVALAILTYAAVGCVIVAARPRHPVGRLMLAGAVGWGVGEGMLAAGLRGLDGGQPDGTVPGAEWLAVLGTAVRGLGWLLLVVMLPLVFPDGRRPFRSLTVPAVAVAAVLSFTAATLLSPVPLESRLGELDSPTGLPDSWRPVTDLMALGALALSGLALAAALRGLYLRWRRGDALMRQQLLWFGSAFAAPLLLLPVIATPVAEPWMFALVSLPLPVAVAVALFQRRLFDIQLAATRTLTYASLWLVLAGTYALVVAGVGAMVGVSGSPWLPWAAAGVVAVAFAPVRDALQRGATRLTYGRWSAPADVLADTGRRLADAADSRALLGQLTDELVHGMGLRAAEVVDAAGRRLAGTGSLEGGTAGQPAGIRETALTAYGRPVGALRWAGPLPRESDRTLLDDLAQQIGAVVHAHGLVEELRDSQERLVQAREQERRRLRRDLHDGLGPSLAGLGLLVDTIGNRIRAGADPTADLARLRAGLQGTVADVRRVVEGLRPPALDELGLFGALAETAHSLTREAGVDLRLDVPEGRPGLPAAVEVAAYRVAQEALTNVVRHAGARSCSLSAALCHRRLVVEVGDDGSGGAAPAAGVGMRSMLERATEIGGRLAVTSTAEGTRVRLELPVPVDGRR